MEYSFNIELAKEYGILEAILLKNIWFWIEKNRANEKNFYDGTYWTYNSTRAFNELFPYASESSIKRALKGLQEKGIIKTGNYNKSSYDRTLLYAFTDLGESIVSNRQMEVNKSSNGDEQNGLTIPDINTNNKTKDIKKEKNKKRKTFEEVLAENNCSEELESSIRDFIDMRKTIKKPMTSKALELLFKNLEKLTNLEEEKIAILNQSIEHGWQTVYPLKTNNMRNSSKGEVKEEEKQEELKEIDISGLTTEEYDLLVKKKITIQDLIKKGRINV